MKYKLAIAYDDASTIVVQDVDNYGVVNDVKNVFYIEKDGIRSFVPIEGVRYFGHAHDDLFKFN